MNVLSLCDVTGNMVRPWIEAGHTATIVDIQHTPGYTREGRLTKVGMDIRDFHPIESFDVVFAFPPCTHLASSGARWWAAKGPEVLAEALDLVNACRRVIEATGSDRWMIENPVGRLSTYWRRPDHKFDPCDFGGYCPEGYGDAYTKKTCLWTGPGFVMPSARRVIPVEGSKMHRMGESKARANLRSATPMGFARAVCLYNENAITLPEVA